MRKRGQSRWLCCTSPSKKGTVLSENRPPCSASIPSRLLGGLGPRRGILERKRGGAGLRCPGRRGRGLGNGRGGGRRRGAAADARTRGDLRDRAFETLRRVRARGHAARH